MQYRSVPRKPEVMSPAGYWPQLRAAIEAGADAVYFGLKHFTARAKVGFSEQELPEALRVLHQRGVKGYVTFNTLVFDNELEEAARALALIAHAGADAVIVQDPAIIQLARRIAPALAIHASTQMSITSADGVEAAQALGASRVTLARELSLEEIRAIREQTECELEIFVHGALCVAYSGQCFSSEAWGGRSANRGQCAQACRLPYELIVDGRVQPLGDARYLLSPGDLFALRQVPDIVAIGVSALKIEGRYKDAEYVALATRAYRKAVDEAWTGLPPRAGDGEEIQLEQVYSRGLGPHFLAGTNHQTVVRGRAPRHRGVLIGRVVRAGAAGVTVEPGPNHALAPLKPGDGVVFDAADWRSPEEPEEGGSVYSILPEAGGRLLLQFGAGRVRPARIRRGDLVWRTQDPEIGRIARPYTQAAAPVRKQPVRVRVRARQGEPLVMEWFLAEQPEVQVTVTSPEPLGAAQSRGVSLDFLRAQLGRLGNTPYELGEIQADVTGSPFAPAAVLNRVRREAVEALQALQGAPRGMAVSDPVAALREVLPRPAVEPPAETPRLHLLVRTPEQLEAAISRRPASITLDYLDLYGLRPSVEKVRSAGILPRVASPRVLKPKEERIVQFLRSLGCPIVVRSAGLLHALQGPGRPPLIGDFSLNAANAISAAMFLELGLERITPSYDLNAEQVRELAAVAGAHKMEAVLYQHLPVFHTEHCVFCRFLSNGTSYRNCGRPCERHQVSVRDARGRAHPVMADVGCRNTVFGAEAQEASMHFDEWQRAGVCHFRLEFAHERSEQVEHITRAFENALCGTIDAPQLRRQLAEAAPQGVTQGSFFVPADYLKLPVLA